MLRIPNFADKTPFAAINLIMQILIILGTVVFMFVTGGTALVSLTLGQGDKERASRMQKITLMIYRSLVRLLMRAYPLWSGYYIPIYEVKKAYPIINKL